MKIDATSKYPVMRSGSNPLSPKAPDANLPKTGKTDVVEIHKGSAPTLDKTLTNLKTNLVQDIAATTTEDRLEALKRSVRSGEYSRSTDELVNAILGQED